MLAVSSPPLSRLTLVYNNRTEETTTPAADSAARAADEQEHKFDDFIQNLLKTADADADAAKAAQQQQAAPPALSLAEKLSALSTVRR